MDWVDRPQNFKDLHGSFQLFQGSHLDNFPIFQFYDADYADVNSPKGFASIICHENTHATCVVNS